MSRQSIAIVGSGISGLACAYFLNRHHDIEVYEKDDRIGGHSNTVIVKEGATAVPIDTGFMVYNEVTYPLLTRLFEDLGVETKPTSMSFSVQHQPSATEFNGGSLNLLFGQRKNLLSIRFWKMLMQISRFNRETVEELARPKFGSVSLDEYVRQRGYGNDFIERYLSPMASAVWSSPPERIRNFPARTLMRFWHNHGFLGLNTQHPWRTVCGGSISYVGNLISSFEHKIHRNCGVSAVSGTEIRFSDGVKKRFDKVIVAAHGDQALGMLADPTPMENEVLGKFHYQVNEAVLHTDPKFMPMNRRCWAAWNYRVEKEGGEPYGYSTHYWMNELQKVSDKFQYFVSINPSTSPAEDHVRKRLTYEHPLFDLDAIAAQERIPGLHQQGVSTGRYYCGAWQRYGFHEDGLWSAVQVCEAILGKDPWS